jgi:hypothetical protein
VLGMQLLIMPVPQLYCLPHAALSWFLAAICRHLLAMNVAQTEAALVATTRCDLALPQQVLGTVLIRAVEGGPPALASSPAFRQALGHMAEQLGVDGVSSRD